MERVWRCKECKNDDGCMLVNQKTLPPETCAMWGNTMNSKWVLKGEYSRSVEMKDESKKEFPYSDLIMGYGGC